MITPSQLLAHQAEQMFVAYSLDHPLWDQLQEAVARGSSGEGGGSSGPRSMPPISTNVLSLLEEIRWAIYRRLTNLVRTNNEELLWHGAEGPLERGPMASPQDNLDRLARRLQAWPEWQLEVAHEVSLWLGQAEVMLGYRRGLERHLRGVHCRECGQVEVIEERNGQKVQMPAIRVFWVGSMIEALACGTCGHITRPHEWTKLQGAPEMSKEPA